MDYFTFFPGGIDSFSQKISIVKKKVRPSPVWKKK